MVTSRAYRLSSLVLLLLCAQCDAITEPTSQVPKAPSALNATASRAGEIEVRWTDQAKNETRFEVEYRAADRTDWYSLATASTDFQFYRHTGLRARDTYVYRVRACNEHGCSEYSNEASATVTTSAVPSALAATASGSGRIDLSWKDNSTDESHFEIDYRMAPSADWYRLDRAASNTTTYSHTGLKAGATYSYRVRACSDAGCSDASDLASATVAGPKPPSVLTAGAVGSGRIDLHWQDNSSDESSFWVEYRRAPSTDWYSLEFTAPNVTSLTHYRLQAGTTYSYRVSSCNASGCSDPTEPVQATVSGPLSPSDLTATPVGSGRIDLRWKDNSNDESSFRVEYRRAPSTDWYILESVAPNATSLSHTRLDAGDTYAYRVRTCNESGCSAPSPEAMATVGAPAQPSNLTATPVGSGRIDLSWQDNSSDETSIQVQSRAAGSASWYVIANLAPNSRAYSNTGLEAGSTYVYRVRSCDGSGCSPYSNEASATAAGPLAPSNLTASATATAVTLSWQDNSTDEERFNVDARAPGSTFWTGLVSLQPGATRYTHGDLQAGVSYVYRVRACNASGCTASSEVAATTSSSPAAPSSLSATPAQTGINLAWRDNSTNEERFQVDVRAAASSSWSLLANTAAGATSHSHTGLKDGDSFAYRVRACNTAGCSAYSNEATGTFQAPGAPAPPTLTSPANGAQGVAQKPTFTWSSVSGATAYRLMVATSAAALPSDKDQDTCSGCVLNVEVPATSHASTVQLAAGTTYRWQVKARTPAGWSGWSAQAVFTVLSQGNSLVCPDGWKEEARGLGVLLCRDVRVLTVDHYVVQVDLKRGARVHNIYDIPAPSNGNPFPDFRVRTVSDWWVNTNQAYTGAFCVLNGAYFRVTEESSPYAELSFPLKNTGSLITLGTDTGVSETGAPKKKSALLWNRDSAWVNKDYPDPFISKVSQVESEFSGAEAAVVAFEPGVEPYNAEGQTFVAVKDADRDGRKEIVMFFVSTWISPSGVERVLTEEFGVVDYGSNAIRLDGGKSSQMRCANGLNVWNKLLGEVREVPHAFLFTQALQ